MIDIKEFIRKHTRIYSNDISFFHIDVEDGKIVTKEREHHENINSYMECLLCGDVLDENIEKIKSHIIEKHIDLK